MEESAQKRVNDLCEAFLLLETSEEIYNFLKDLCTPQEISTLAERWRVCQLLEKGDLSYREIHSLTGASLTTIGRVARFLKDESYHGYQTILNKIKNEK
jgi:TrpR-related protein YerC/YecD